MGGHLKVHHRAPNSPMAAAKGAQKPDGPGPDLIEFHATQLGADSDGQLVWKRSEGTCRSPRPRSKRYHNGTRQSVASCVESPSSRFLLDRLHL